MFSQKLQRPPEIKARFWVRPDDSYLTTSSRIQLLHRIIFTQGPERARVCVCGGGDTYLCGREVVCLPLVQDFSYSGNECVCVCLCVWDCCVGVKAFPDVIRAVTVGDRHRHVRDPEFIWKLKPHFLPSSTERENSRQWTAAGSTESVCSH